MFKFFKLNLKKRLFSILLVLAILVVVSITRDAPLETYSGKTMGTHYKVSLTSSSNNPQEEKIFNILDAVNKEMSTYKEASLISQFNNLPVNTWFEISSSFATVLKQAISICELTNGYFDVTVGRLVNMWGFGPAKTSSRPGSKKIEEILKEVSCNSVIFNRDFNQIKKIKDVEIDFSAIAKGYAVDKVSEFLLDNKSIKGFMVDVGGEIRVYGSKNKYTPWSVGITHPKYNDKPIYEFQNLSLGSFAMATSGDYRNIRIFDDEVITHTINTKNGKPRLLEITSVSVIDPSAMKADALATALNAMGVERGREFVNRHNLKVVFVYLENNQFKTEVSENLQKLVQ